MKFLWLSLFVFSSAFAGNEGGGGYVIYCDDRPVQVLDYYEATLPGLNGVPNLLSLNPSELEFTKQQILRRFSYIPDYMQTILTNHRDVLNTENWIIADLDIFQDDTNVAYKGCSKMVRAAHRQNGTVYLQTEIAPSLGEEQMYILSLHEWLYASSRKNTSESVRHVIRELLKAEKEFNPSRFVNLVGDLMSSWTTIDIKKSLNISSIGSEQKLNQVCREYGAEYVTYVKGRTRTQRNCGGDCTTWYISEITCAKLN